MHNLAALLFFFAKSATCAMKACHLPQMARLAFCLCLSSSSTAMASPTCSNSGSLGLADGWEQRIMRVFSWSSLVPFSTTSACQVMTAASFFAWFSPNSSTPSSSSTSFSASTATSSRSFSEGDGLGSNALSKSMRFSCTFFAVSIDGLPEGSGLARLVWAGSVFFFFDGSSSLLLFSAASFAVDEIFLLLTILSFIFFLCFVMLRLMFLAWKERKAFDVVSFLDAIVFLSLHVAFVRVSPSSTSNPNTSCMSSDGSSNSSFPAQNRGARDSKTRPRTKKGARKPTLVFVESDPVQSRSWGNVQRGIPSSPVHHHNTEGWNASQRWDREEMWCWQRKQVEGSYLAP
mmetsp:Transcript_4070/g.25555  ORF Transcript_4070/g.25555 Transcript_4070/m.25555 type:complete len:346 (+) Transcript_4070:760-1797(+)